MDRQNNEHLGVNKMGKNIRKSPLQQPNFTNPAREQPQPQLYNVNKNDFRNFVQQLTGSPLREPLPIPPQNPPKPRSMRLQKIRPPPLTPINRSPIPIHPPASVIAQSPVPVPYGNNFVRPPAHYGQPLPTMLPPMTPGASVLPNVAESPVSAYMRYLQNSVIDSGLRQSGLQQQPFPQSHPHYGQPSPTMLPPMTPGASFRPNVAESPVSAYMRYLQNSLIDSGPGQSGPQSQPFPQLHPHIPSRFHAHPPPAGLLPNSTVPSLPSHQVNGNGLLPSPRMNGLPPLSAPRMNGPPFPSPRMNGPPPLLPSPTSEFLLSSPTGFLNLFSPQSLYPLLSPVYQQPPLLTPKFSFSPMAQTGILGPGPLPPSSPGLGFPLSPVFFPILSPRWREQ